MIFVLLLSYWALFLQSKYDLLTSTPLDVIVNTARGLLKSSAHVNKPAVSPTAASVVSASIPALSSLSVPQPQPQQSKEEELPWNYKTVRTEKKSLYFPFPFELIIFPF